MTPTRTKRPPLPPGRLLTLPGRGTTFVRETGPIGAPAVVLVHGVMVTGDLNWFSAFGPLSGHFRVVSLDLRGHGHGPDADRWFRLDDCADDVAALIRTLGLRPAIVAGYSMGGLIAQLVWRRHRDLVAGLVLCATARNFRGTPLEQLISLSLPGFASMMRYNPFLQAMGAGMLRTALTEDVPHPSLRQWALDELALTNLATTTAAVEEVYRFTSHSWVGGVDVPTTVLVPRHDRVVAPARQHRLAAAIPGAHVLEVDGGHGVCVRSPARFGAALLSACSGVAARSSLGGSHPGPRMAAG
jgi:3-oxoadipate enol-lactonase